MPKPLPPKTPTPTSAKSEADALLAELEHPPGSDQSTPEPENTASIVGTTLKTLFNWLITPAAIVIVLHFFVFQAFQVVGHSMEPTLQNENYLIISKVGPTFARLEGGAVHNHYFIPKREDIVVFIAPPNPSQNYVKRAIALPGERVVVKDGKITVYNQQHPQGFSPDTSHLETSPITLGNIDEVVKPGFIFVVGDNRLPNESYDSRDWGELPSSNIIGTAVLRLLPVSNLKIL